MRRFAALAVLLVATAARAEAPLPPAPAHFVTDRAGFLSPAAAEELDGRLARYAQSTGHQIIVYIDHTTGGAPIDDWAVRAFKSWRVGRSGIDDGVALFLFADDRRARIEVGYGLEASIPDARASRIIEEQIIPRVRAGDRDGAIRAGVDALTAAAGGAAEPPPAAAARPPLWTLIGGALLLLLFIGFAITHPSLAWLMLLSIGSGGRGGGFGGGGGGGFSGGGGRSGGGGASGSW